MNATYASIEASIEFQNTEIEILLYKGDHYSMRSAY